MSERLEAYYEMLETAEACSDKLNDWEQMFVADLMSKIESDENCHLTEKQVDKIKAIYEKATDI